MSESVATGETTGDAAGRYLYCLVRLDGADETEGPPRLDTTGIEGAPVDVVEAAAAPVGAVVHPRREPFDSTDLTKLRDWLLAHQRVVEAAGDRFGTPLPVRFDTVLEGDDDAVAAWLGRNADQVADAFDDVAGCWEYRVTLSWDSTAFESEQRATDARLSEIDRRLDQSGDGKRFLLEKQYDQRVRELVRERQAALKSELVDRLAEESSQVTERPVQSDAAASLGVELDDDAVAQVALLAPPDRESEVGSVLDEVAATPGVDVRFTGPWPPYTFTTQITDDA
ncbi:MAG: gas vesicle protein GvpL [Haloferacaceae archaeon]